MMVPMSAELVALGDSGPLPAPTNGAESGRARGDASESEDTDAKSTSGDAPEGPSLPNISMLMARIEEALLPEAEGDERDLVAVMRLSPGGPDGHHRRRRHSPRSQAEIVSGVPTPLRRWELQCANPECPFLINSDDVHGGYCCKQCHWVYRTGSKIKKHGVFCERRYAPEGALRSVAVTPVNPLKIEGIDEAQLQPPPEGGFT